jgi:CMP-2-keto-3-deoxyoctulosonic acid synthetase
MAKKNFKSGMDLLLQGSKRNEVESGKTKEARHKTKVKSTYLYDAETLEAIKAISHYRRIPIGDVINEACKMLIDSFESLEKAMKLYANHQSGK